jgi:chromosome segregation ATPase
MSVVEAHIDSLRAQVAKLERRIVELTERAEALEVQLRQRDERIAQLEPECAGKDAEIARLRIESIDKVRTANLAEDNARALAANRLAALCRAVSLLNEALPWIEAESIALKDAIPYEECIDKIKAFAKDPTCAAAGEYVEALEREHDKDTRRIACSSHIHSEACGCEECEWAAELAAVEKARP